MARAEEREGRPETKPPCRVVWLGRQDYQEAWKLQKETAGERLAGELPDTLLLLEHPPTITLGRAADRSHLRASAAELERAGITVVESDRGGDVTYHGPGQLVGYPILNLREPPHTPDLHAYLRALEETLIRALAVFGVIAGRFPGYTGVWTRLDTPHPEKIAAIGIKSSRWITLHGFALNVCPDLSHFDRIVPCGIHEYGVTSLSRLLDRPVAMAAVLPSVEAAFLEVFGYAPSSPSLLLPPSRLPR
jgi:lipoate-protein ligase B